MLDAFYQSVVIWFLAYPVFEAANFVTYNGLSVNGIERIGIYVAHPAIVIVNIYILLNTYRWDWLILLLVFISIAAIWFWTGVYSSLTASSSFYRSAAQVYSQPTFWAVLFLICTVGLLPRFAGKSYQKIFRPRDIDIIREQIRLGEFDHLKGVAPVPSAAPEKHQSVSTEGKSATFQNRPDSTVPEDERPIYPPSVAPTATTHNPRSQNGSDGTDFIGHRLSLENPRLSLDRPRPSFDRLKKSMHRTRPSLEASRDFSSAAYLTKIESSQSGPRSP